MYSSSFDWSLEPSLFFKVLLSSKTKSTIFLPWLILFCLSAVDVPPDGEKYLSKISLKLSSEGIGLPEELNDNVEVLDLYPTPPSVERERYGNLVYWLNSAAATWSTDIVFLYKPLKSPPVKKESPAIWPKTVLLLGWLNPPIIDILFLCLSKWERDFVSL